MNPINFIPYSKSTKDTEKDLDQIQDNSFCWWIHLLDTNVGVDFAHKLIRTIQSIN